jgi:hypothetical protein
MEEALRESQEDAATAEQEEEAEQRAALKAIADHQRERAPPAAQRKAGWIEAFEVSSDSSADLNRPSRHLF